MAGSTSASRPRTPSRSPVPPTPNSAVPPMPGDEPRSQPGTRRSSFSFLRRGKSVERLNSKRSTSGGKLTKKQLKEQEMERAREAAAIPKQAPKIPDLTPHAQIQEFADAARPDSLAIMSNNMGGYRKGWAPAGEPSRPVPLHGVPIPPIPGSQKDAYVDPYARTESMTNRGRYSYASSAVSTINSPRRVRRRKDPTPFNILVVGARNSGKTSFIEFLRTSLALPPRKIRPVALHDHAMDAPQVRTSPNFVSHYLETEMDDGERIGLTLWDSEGLDKTIMDLQLQEMSSFLESKFEDTFNEEMKVIRSPGVRDTHIHCVFLVLDPLRLDASIAASQKKLNASNGAFAHGKSYLHPPSPAVAGGLDETLDLQVLKVLEGKTTVVPIISKADTITSAHMAQLKRTVWDSLKKTNIDPLEALGLDDGEGDADDSDSDEPGHTPHHTPQKAPFPKPHDSKRLDERDEDHFLQPNHASPDRVATPLSTTSHLESASSSTSSSGSPARRPANQPHPTDSRQSSSTFPSHGPAPTADADAATPYLPLSIISPDPIVAHEPRVGRVGRKFPWGCADPYNPEHCDFVRLKEAVFKEWRGELREASRELWYENWRTSRLNSSHGKGRAGGPNGVNGQNGHGGHGGHGGHAGHGVQQAGLQQAGLQQAGLQQAGLQQAGLQQASLQKAGLQQAGLQQAGLQQRASPRAPALSPLGSHAVGVAR